MSDRASADLDPRDRSQPLVIGSEATESYSESVEHRTQGDRISTTFIDCTYNPQDSVDLEFALKFNARRQSLLQTYHSTRHPKHHDSHDSQTHPQPQARLIDRHHSSSSSSASSSSNASESSTISNRTIRTRDLGLLHTSARARHPTTPSPDHLCIDPASAVGRSASHLGFPSSSASFPFNQASVDYLEKFQDDPLVEDPIENLKPVSLYSPITVTTSSSASRPVSSVPSSIDHETRSIDFTKARSRKDSKKGILFSGERINSRNRDQVRKENQGKGNCLEVSQSTEDKDHTYSGDQSRVPSDLPAALTSPSTSDSKKKDLSLISSVDRDNLFISTSLAKAFDRSRSVLESDSQKERLDSHSTSPPSGQVQTVKPLESSPVEPVSIIPVGSFIDVEVEQDTQNKIRTNPDFGIIGMKTESNLDSNTRISETTSIGGRRPSFWERARKLSSTNANDAVTRGRSSSSVSAKNKDGGSTFGLGGSSRIIARDRDESSSSPEFTVRSVEGRKKSFERFESNANSTSSKISRDAKKDTGFSGISSEDETFASNSSLHAVPLIRNSSKTDAENSKSGLKSRNRGQTLPSFINPISLDKEVDLLDASSGVTSTSEVSDPQHIHLHRSALAIQRQDEDGEIITLLTDGKGYDSDSDDNVGVSLDSNLTFGGQNVGSSHRYSHGRSQSEDRSSTSVKDNSIKDLARVKRRRKLLKDQINTARKAKDSVQTSSAVSQISGSTSASNGVNGRRRSASSVTSISDTTSNLSSSKAYRRSSVTGGTSLREVEGEEDVTRGGGKAVLTGKQTHRITTDGSSPPTSEPISLEEEFEAQVESGSNLNSSLNVESIARFDETQTPSIISSVGEDSFYDAIERETVSSSSVSYRSESDQPQKTLHHSEEQSPVSENHGLRSSRRRFNTSTSNGIASPIGLGIEHDTDSQSNTYDKLEEDYEDEDTEPTLDRKKTICPMVSVATSSATLREDARARDPSSSSVSPASTSRSPSHDARGSFDLVNIFNSDQFSNLSSSHSSSSNASQNESSSNGNSPISSLSASNFSSNIPIVSPSAPSKMFIRSPSLRGSRIVPPLKPSPTSPLPPPPPNFNSSPVSSVAPFRQLSGVVSDSSDGRAAGDLEVKDQEMDAVVMKLKNLGKSFGEQGGNRSRSQSLGQASEDLRLQSQSKDLLSTLQNTNSSNQKSSSRETFSTSGILPPPLSRTTSTDSSNRRNRSSDHLPPSLTLRGSMTNPVPSPLSTSRPRHLSSTTEENELMKPSDSSSKEASASPSSTRIPVHFSNAVASIKGRPRGATVGAVPYSGSNNSAHPRVSVQTRTRPRSLLSNEIIIPDSVRAEWEKEAREKSSHQSNARASALNATSEQSATSTGIGSSTSVASTTSSSRSFGDDYLSAGNADTSASSSASGRGDTNSSKLTSPGSTLASNSTGAGGGNGVGGGTSTTSNGGNDGGSSERSGRSRSGSRSNNNGNGNAGGSASGSGGRDREGGGGGRSRSGSNASLLQQVQHPPKSHASFVIAVVGHRGTGKSTVIKKGLRQFGLSKPNVLSEKVTSHSTVCVVDQEQRTIEVLEIDASVLLNAPGKRFAWPKFLPRIDAVILCYDAGQISSFRGMSELLDNFAQGHLSTVMLACKSEIFPKQVDPYYASDMAAVYNVGLAECTVQSEEGKKRMRDCFSYLVKEVAKARAGRQRRANASSHQQSSREREKEREREHELASGRRNRAGSGSSSAVANANASASGDPIGNLDGGSSVSVHSASSSHESRSSTRDRNNSGASSTVESVPSAASSGPLYSEEHTATIAQQQYHLQQQRLQSQLRSEESLSETERYKNVRKMSDATTASDAPSFADSNPEEEEAVQQSISKAQLGLQSAQSAGGYVSIDELWDKFFFAAVSGNDERFLLMFMVFYRGFAKPIDLLRQLIERFDKLAMSERSDGVMIRFSLMRLTNMLGEWVQDYPGDLSGLETYPVVCSFYQKLLQHPSTVHVASPLQPHIEACRYAPDVDAVWSKAEDSDKPQSVAADVAPISTMINPELSGSAISLEKPPSTKSANSSGSVPSVNSPPPPLPGQDEGTEGMTRSRGQSDASSFGPPMDSSHLSPKPIETRHRSASDVTSTSSDGLRGPQSVAGSGITASSASVAPSTVSSSNPVADRSPSEQKSFLRGVSNALGELDEEAIAGELTRVEWNLFTAIRPRDLLRHILVARDLREKNGPVARSIAHFNYVSFWVCSMILVQGKTKHRAKMLEKFMNVAAILRRDNNYNTLHSVLAGLGNASIHRLKHTRELLNGKPVIKTYQSLARLMGSDRSFAAYRLALENSENRTIPYLGVHLQDILSMSDGNPSKRSSDGMVHWRKFSLMDEAVMAIVKCQQHDRPTKPNPAVERLIMDLPVMDEEPLYQRSLEVEPRSSQPSKIKKLMMQGTAS